MTLYPHISSNLSNLRNVEELKLFKDPELLQYYNKFLQKLLNDLANVTKSKGFRLIDYNDFGIAKVGDPPEVTFQSLISSLCQVVQFHDMERSKLSLLFKSFLMTLRYDKNISIGKFEYLQYFSAFPLLVYKKPTGIVRETTFPSSNRLVDLLDYTPVWIGEVDISNISTDLNYICDNSRIEFMEKLFQRVYDISRVPAKSDIDIQDCLQDHILCPLAEFLSNVFETEFVSHKCFRAEISPHKVFGSRYKLPYLFFPMTPSFVLEENGKPILCGLIKSFPLFEGDPTFEQLLHQDDFKETLNKLVASMTAVGVSRGFISDSHTTLFIEIDCKMLGSNIDQIINVPMRASIFNNQSFTPSILQMFLYFIYKGYHSPDNLHDFIKSCGYFGVKRRQTEFPSSPILKQSMGITTLVLDPDHIGQVFKVPAVVIKQFIDIQLDDSEFVVLKIFDKSFPQIWKLTRDDIESCCEDDQRNAQRTIEVLSKDSRFNNVYLPHKDETITYDLGYGYYLTGKLILSRFIQTSPLPKDVATYKKLEEQLYVLQSHEIIHCNITEENILYDADTQTPYIINFEKCEKGKGNDDIDCLKSIFEVD